MRVLSWNVNGLRAVLKKGFAEWLQSSGADVVGLQETRASMDQVQEETAALDGWHFTMQAAVKKGYSGVGLYTRKAPSAVIQGFDAEEFDSEGRWIETRFDTARRKLSLISCYFPSGSSSEERQQAKFRFLAKMLPHLMRLKQEREFILMGDVNIAHQAIDLKNWRSNQKNSGFTPEERAWMTHLLTEVGLVDVFRTLNPHPEQYTWWSNRGQAWAKNVGWRIDYHLATPGLAALARKEHIYLDQRFSDHAPLIIDYDFQL